MLHRHRHSIFPHGPAAAALEQRKMDRRLRLVEETTDALRPSQLPAAPSRRPMLSLFIHSFGAAPCGLLPCSFAIPTHIPQIREMGN